MLNDMFPFFSNLSDTDKGLVQKSIITRQFHEDEMVNQTANGCAGLLAVESGQLRVYIMSDEGREVTLFRVDSGEICVLSVSCVLDSIMFDVLIKATEETTVRVIPAAVLKSLMAGNDKVSLFLYKTAAEKFSDVMWTMHQLLFMRVDQRIAIYLWDEMNRQKDTELALTHEMIARQIGSSREVITKIMRYFEEEKILSLSRGKITVLDKNALKAKAYPAM